MSPDIRPELSFSPERARELTQQALELQPWFQELKPDEQQQALDLAIRTITSRFSDAHRRVSYKSWEFIRDSFDRQKPNPIKEFQRKYIGSRAISGGRGNNPWELVYLSMQQRLPDIAAAKKLLSPHQERKNNPLWDGKSTPGVRSTFRQTKTPE